MRLAWDRATRLGLGLFVCCCGSSIRAHAASGSEGLAHSASPSAARAPLAVDPPHGWPDDAFSPVTAQRISALPAAEQAAWRAYLDTSAERARKLPPMSPTDEAALGPVSAPPKGGLHTKGLPTEQVPADWYVTGEALAIADRVVERQSAAGAWTKGIDYTRPDPGAERVDIWSRGTFDNEATSAELRFLARMIAANDTKRARTWRSAVLRGLDYILAAQYPNGGFPQVYPLAGGYHDAITYNDGAMLRALAVLQDVARRKAGYAFVPEARRAEAARRLQRGVECILATQIRTPDGRRTVWSQQHDALTGRPCAARNFEPIAASALESTMVCRFLMSLPAPTPAVTAAVSEAVAWFERVAVHDVEWQRANVKGNGLLVVPGAPRLWARFYEIGTDKPIFGDRDRTIHYSVTEISSERRLGYQWYGDWPQAVVAAHRR